MPEASKRLGNLTTGIISRLFPYRAPSLLTTETPNLQKFKKSCGTDTKPIKFLSMQCIGGLKLVESIPTLKYRPMKENRELKDFKPRGAVAFFIGLIALYAVMWFAIYALLIISRGG